MFLLRQIKFKGNLTWQSLANNVQIIINGKPLQVSLKFMAKF
jgi:hypothetical protein